MLFLTSLERRIRAASISQKPSDSEPQADGFPGTNFNAGRG